MNQLETMSLSVKSMRQSERRIHQTKILILLFI